MPPTSFATAYKNLSLTSLFALEPGATDAALAQPRPVDRLRLAAVLAQQAERLGAPAAVFDALAKLEHPESRVVVTGQQTGLLLGPLYTLSKAISALKLAAQLSTEARPVVPLFWLATQDADSAEIDHAYLLDMDETLHRLSLPLPAGVPAGRIALSEAWLETLIRELREVRGPEAHKLAVTDLLRRTATRAESFADWFGALLYELLGSQGLIVFDPLAPAAADLFAPLLRAELSDPLRSGESINTAAEALRELGYTPQLGRAEGATNLFLTTDKLADEPRDETPDETPNEQRRLLRFDGTTFHTDAGSYTKDELLARLDADPTCLTPAAGLRPITQDAALPTAATVVGPGELRYIAQLRGVYEQHGVAMPLIWPRTTVTILEPPVARILDKFGLTAGALQADWEGLQADTLLTLHGHKLAFDNRLRALKNLSASLRTEVSAIDPTLAQTVNRAETELHDIFSKLETKSAAALAGRDDIYTRQFGRLRAHLLPANTPQERLLSPFSFFLKFGVDAVMDALLTLPAEGDHDLRI